MATGGEEQVGYSLVRVGTVILKKTDEYPWYISIVVCQDKIVVLDFETDTVDIHGLHDGKFQASSDSLESEPRDMCLMDAMTICVIHLNGLIKMMFIDSTDMSRDIKTTKTIRLQGVLLDRYDGVVRFKDSLVVTGVKEGMMYWCIVSLQDGHVDKIHQICKGYVLCSVTTKDTIIYISCWAGDESPNNTGVYGFDILNPSQCKYKYKHQLLQMPTSIVINEDGNIFVCNNGFRDDCIHQLTASCQLVAIFTQGIPLDPYRLRALFWDNGCLYGTYMGSRDITVFSHMYQGNQKYSEVETSMEIEQGNVDKGQSNVKTEMPPSGPSPEHSKDEEQVQHKASEVLMGQERQQPFIEETSTEIVQEIIDKDKSSVKTEMPSSGPSPGDPESIPNPEDSEYRPDPEDSESRPNPKDSEYRPNPEDSESGPNREDSEYRPNPEDSESRLNPEDSESRPSPEDSESRPCPADSESRTSPGDSESRPSPEDSESRPNPKDSQSRPSPGDSQSRPSNEDPESRPNPEDSETRPSPADSESSVKTEMPPSGQFLEDTKDEKQGHNASEVQMCDERKPVIDETSTKIVQAILIQQIVAESLNQAGFHVATEETDLFLKFQREIGTTVHFSKDPHTLVDGKESLKVTEMFLQEKHPDMMDKWHEFTNQGKLTPELIDVVYAQERNQELHDKKNDILGQMEQLNIIVKARSFDEKGVKEEDYFLTPCMLHQESPREVISPKHDPRMVSTSVLCFVFTENDMQPRIFNELIAAFVRRWPVAKKMETSENLMFCNCAVYDLDLFHRLILHYRNHVVFARVTRMVRDEAETPDAKLWTRVRKFISLNLRNITSRLDHNLKYELCVQSQESQDVSEDSMFHFSPPFHTWFLDEEHDPESPITREHMNHARLNVALVTICGKAMREVLLANFDTQYKDIYQAILAKKGNLIPARGKHLLNQHQIQLVYPDPKGQTTGTVDQFDLSLLYTLIRNVSTVPEPTTLWGNDPLDTPRDNSLGASVERIRSYRNLISGHSPDAKMEQQEFDDYWKQIDAVLRDIENALGKHVYCSELAKHKSQVISVFEA